MGNEYALVLSIDILIAALFAASLRLVTGVGGIVSFGHAAYFGIGAYASALAATHGVPFIAAIVVAPVAAALAALAFGALCVRLSGIYLAMLTLAFAQIVWSIALQWDAVTGGSNGITGVWPPDWLAARTRYYLLVLAIAAVALTALALVTFTPFGYALRGSRDSQLRAEASGIDVRARRIKAFAIAGGFAGLAGSLFAYSKGGTSPEALAIPRSVDVLVMMLLGGQNVLFGPLIGAAAFTWLQDVLARATDYWRAAVGVVILFIVSVFPYGIGGAFAGVFRSRRTPP
jgi:branched-chain amino acid transport system permease protein